MRNTPDDGLNFFRGVLSITAIYFLCLWIVCIFMLIF